MNESRVKQKINRARGVFIFSECILPISLIISLILYRLNPFCDGVKEDHMGCGIAGFIICCAIALLGLFSSLIGMIICSLIIRKQKTILARITLSHYVPTKISFVLSLFLLILFFGLFMAIFMPLFSGVFRMEGGTVALPIALSAFLGISLSVLIAYLLRT